MLMTRPPSLDCQVQLVAPIVCPGVKWAVTASGPSLTTSPSRTLRVLAAGVIASRLGYCGSRLSAWPDRSTATDGALPSTVAPLSFCKAAMPPA